MTQEIETIGLAMDTSGVERGIRSLDELAGRGPKVEKSLKGVEAAASQAGKGVGSLGSANSKGLDDIAKAGDRAAQGLGNVGKAAQSAVSSQQALAQAVSSFTSAERGYVQSLMDEYKQLTMNRGERAAYTAQSKGMSAAAQEVAAAVGKKIEALQKEQAATAKSASGMEGLTLATRTAAAGLAAIGIGLAAGDLIKMADASTNVASRLTLVTSSTAELAQVQKRLFDVAQSSRVSFVDLVGTYSQVARSTKELGVSQNSLLGVINTISQAVTISGGSAQSAQAALIQLSQGFAAGALRGEELNSIMEQTPRLAQALADGLGVGVGKLREMGQAGELTAEKVLGALEKSAASVAKEFEKMAVTVEQASTQASNSVLRLVGAFDKLTGATSFISSGITSVSKALDFLASDMEKIGSQKGLRSAADDVLTLDRRATILRNGLANGFYGPGFQAELDSVNARLQVAKQRFNELKAAMGGGLTSGGGAGRGSVNPTTTEEAATILGGLDKYLQGDARQTKSQIRTEEIQKAVAANAKLLESINKLSNGEEKTMALTKARAALEVETANINEKHKDKTAGGVKAEQSAYETLTKTLREKIAAEQIELATGKQVSESQKLRLKYAEELKGSLKGLNAAERTVISGLLDKYEAEEKNNAMAKEAMKIAQDAMAARKKEADGIKSWMDAQEQAAAQSLQSVQDRITGLKNEELAVATSRALNVSLAEAIERLAIARMKEKQAGFYEGSEGWENLQKEIDKRKELLLLVQGKDRREASDEANKQFLSEWQNSVKQYDDIFRQGFADMLNKGEDGWKSFTKSLATTFKTTVADTLYKAFAQPFVVQIVGQLMGLTGTSGAAASLTGSGGSSGLGMLSNITSLFGGGSSGGILDILGSTGMGALDIGGFSLGSAASSLAGSLGSFVAAAGPWAAAAMAIYSIARSLDHSGTPHIGSMAQYSEAGGLSNSQTHGAYGMGFGGVDYSESTATMVAGVSRTVVGILDSVSQAFGGRGGFTVSTGFADDSSEDGAWGGLLIEQFGQALVNWDTDRSSRWAPREFSDGEAGQREYLAALAQDVTGVLREMDLPSWAQATLTALGKSPSLESLATAIDQINATKAALDTMGKNLVGFASYSDAAASALIKASGGISALAANASAYYENFYTEAERQANATRDVTAALAAVNIALPASREAYRALVEQYTAMGTAGASTLAVLLGVSGAFAAITPAAEAAATAITESLEEAIVRLRNPERSVEDIARNTISLEDRLAQVQNAGNTAALRERELRGLTAAEAALQRRIWLLEDEARVSTERDNLELQYLQLTGNTAAIRERERAALDETNRALYDRNAALADEQAMLSQFGITASSMADIIRDGMLGRLSQEDVGARLTEMIVGGINNALASRFADQISTLFIDSIITPMLTAVTTGGSISAAVSQSSIDAVIASATAAAANMAAIFNDPAWQAAMDAINTAIRGVSGAVAKPVTPVYDNSGYNDAINAAYEAAQEAKKAWKGVSDTIIDEVKRIRGEMVGGTAQSMSNAQAQFAIATAQARAGDQDAAKSLPGLSQALLTIAEAQASSTLELRRIQAATAASLEITNASIAKKYGLQVPSFDVGTNYVPQDMLAMVHKGEQIVPAAFNPALAGGTSSSGNAELVQEVRALRGQISVLESRLESIDRSTKRTSQELDDFSRNGIPVINQPDTKLATA